MIIIIQLLNDPLDGFVNEEVQLLQRKIKNAISLDNFSEEWLVRRAIDQIKEVKSLTAVILRTGDAEIKNVSPIISLIPQMEKAKILYYGLNHPLISRMQNFPNINYMEINDFKKTINFI